MKRRNRIRAVSFLLALFSALTAWAVSATVKANAEERVIRAGRQRALTQVSEYLDSMSVTLQKAAYSNSPAMLGKLAGELKTQAAGAKTGLSALETGGAQLYNTYKFLSQVGEYTSSLESAMSGGKKRGETETKNLKTLLDCARTLSDSYSYMADLMDSGQFSFEEIKKYASVQNDAEEAPVVYSDAASGAEDKMKDFPTLIYDGPFSDNIYERESALLNSSDPISEKAAKAKAAKILGVSEKKLISDGETGGRLASYAFHFDKTRISVTKNGGFLHYILCQPSAGEEKLSADEAMKAAADFLKKAGYNNMEPSYSAGSDGICTVNFAFTQGEYICYPDLIKVGVSLDDGRIITADASDYLMNHTRRKIPAEKTDEAAARASAADGLKVTAVNKAVIPTPGGYESFAYELRCTDADGNDALVYIDTSTGQEDDILLLLYSDGGTLTK